MSADYPKWAPRSAIERVKKTPTRWKALADRLLRDPRMEAVWEWWSVAGRKTRYPEPFMFIYSVERALEMPGKPGNMSPAKRTAYMKRVRKHAEELLELLAGTRYDCRAEEWYELPENGWQAYVERELEGAVDFCQSEDCDLFVGIRITANGLERAPWDYPYGELAMLLDDVIAWTHQDDFFGRGALVSSRPMRASRENLHVNFFNCRFYVGYWKTDGLKVPFPILATLANVALNLPADEEVNEFTAQKQVKRYMQKWGADEKPRALGF